MSSLSHAATETSDTVKSSDITRAYEVSSHHTLALTRNHFIIETPALDNHCTSVYFDSKENPASLSVALAAMISKSDLDLFYYTDVLSPWGDAHSCALTGIVLKP